MYNYDLSKEWDQLSEEEKLKVNDLLAELNTVTEQHAEKENVDEEIPPST